MNILKMGSVGVFILFAVIALITGFIHQEVRLVIIGILLIVASLLMSILAKENAKQLFMIKGQ
ncbi:hypothetical protein [Acinetobacter sp. YH12047]|uniref:hypothetical protein n=1 Tax=Acinetobacter sp. YH12047 TaxID=2601053 RepID=UPI0015D401E7|nr:hypothetical protein [Acinetobacter sp. YH12047]